MFTWVFDERPAVHAVVADSWFVPVADLITPCPAAVVVGARRVPGPTAAPSPVTVRTLTPRPGAAVGARRSLPVDPEPSAAAATGAACMDDQLVSATGHPATATAKLGL